MRLSSLLGKARGAESTMAADFFVQASLKTILLVPLSWAAATIQDLGGQEWGLPVLISPLGVPSGRICCSEGPLN